MTQERDPMLFPPPHVAIEKAFTPHSPIRLRDLLAGRSELLMRAIDNIHTPGLHVILFGDRGVGKTSLARVLEVIVREPRETEGLRSIYVSCDSETTFTTLWDRVIDEVRTAPPATFATAVVIPEKAADDLIGPFIETSHDARRFVRALPNPVVLFVDEFDRVPKESDAPRLMADTIKLFSDTETPCTIVIVGVAESISQLISQHESITRHIAEVRVDPMSPPELAEIIQKGFSTAGLRFDKGLDLRIAQLSQGYPHYTHLLGLWSGREAVGEDRNRVTFADLTAAIPKALARAAGSVQQEYERAVESAQPGALFDDVLLACAMAARDSIGRFKAADLREPLRAITGTSYATSAFLPHLNKFASKTRGPVLRRTGERKSYKWQFVNPQLIPYVRLMGVQRERITG